MDGITEVGVFCGVCHRWNDGASDFCACRESLVGYRPLNAKQVASWVTGQLRERDAAGVPSSAEDVEALREWAGRGDPSHPVARRDGPQTQDEVPSPPPPPPPPPREGCLLTGMTVAFWFSVFFVTYMTLGMVLDYTVVDWFHLGWAFLTVAIAGVVVGLLVWRFPRVNIWLRIGVVVVVVGGMVSLVGYAVATAPARNAEAEHRHEGLASALETAVSAVMISTDWETEPFDTSRSVGLRTSPDLSSSGTWMLFTVTTRDVSEEGESPEDRMSRTTANLTAAGNQIVDELRTASVSGVPGYEYEVSGITGDRTGQDLGAHIAIFFGPEYTYELTVQFELSDRDEASILYRETLFALNLDGVDNEN
jgi:hypothetical protein